ncbi:MAG TPA: polysaccharide biosynthesis protein [Nitrososphaerales archaeon]|nr:polysaccharide biosynthesis protein [Nitrososphaerales archaeon]
MPAGKPDPLSQFKDSTVLITGGSGSIGTEIMKSVLKYSPKKVRIFTNDENGLFELAQPYGKLPNVEFRLGDVRDLRSLDPAVEGCDYVFHAAALKHVDFCETNPYEAITTNITGTQNVIDLCMKHRVKRFVFISTDKAVNPTSTMGATKLLAEKLVIRASRQTDRTIFSAVRFGNVIGSRGSVVILFEKEVRAGKPMTVTDPTMTRFIMATSQAAMLVLRSSMIALPGEIFVLKMKTVRIGDLAEASRIFFARMLGKKPASIKVKVVGTRPGEKMHEELLNGTDARDALDLGDFYVVNPHPDRTAKGNPPKAGHEAGLSSNDFAPMPVPRIVKELEAIY